MKTDLRHFSFDKLNTEEYSHLKLLLYWPLYGLMFFFVERVYQPSAYIVMHCSLDDMIPFCEYFLIPYLYWFIYLTGTIVYTLFFDVPTFKKMMRFIIITYSFTLFIYLIFPTCQNLRPESFARDNFLTRFMHVFYSFDTNTNVCPSLHVIGSLAAMFALWETPRFRSSAWRAVTVTSAVLICVSTVFVKQHSAADVIAALPICLAAYFICFNPRKTAVHSGKAVRRMSGNV